MTGAPAYLEFLAGVGLALAIVVGARLTGRAIGRVVEWGLDIGDRLASAEEPSE